MRSPGCPSGTQNSFAPHDEQTLPPLPQAVESLPATHCPAAVQQPPQFCGPHDGVPSHLPPPPVWPLQTWPAAQLVHCSPAAPQDKTSLPARHLSPTQQPLQFVASHLPAPHARVPASQARPSTEQSAQLKPLRPQALGSVPLKQRCRPPSRLQQPGHVAELHAGLSRPHTRRSVQIAKPWETQSEQRDPLLPHARVSPPVRQMPLASQQPFGHVDGPHACVGPPSRKVSGSRLVRPQPGAIKTKKMQAKTESATTRPSCEKRMRKTSLAQRSATLQTPVACLRSSGGLRSPAEPLDFTFLAIPIFQRALGAGAVLAALLALLGVLVTARGLAYLGDGLSHAAFGGIALGMFLGMSTPLVVAIPFTALAAMAIGALRRRGGLQSDVAMAILFAVCFAVGVVLLKKSKRTQSTFDPEQLLFGNILLVGTDNLWIVLGIGAVTVAFVVVAWTRLAYATFDEELARLSGIEVGWLESALLALLAAVVVAAIRLAGVVLVSAFLVIPAAAGRLLGRTLAGVVGWAMLAGVLGVLCGFVAAHRFEWPEGAAIVLTLALLFAAAAGVRRVRA